MHCERGNRDCVYTTKPPTSPFPPDPSTVSGSSFSFFERRVSSPTPTQVLQQGPITPDQSLYVNISTPQPQSIETLGTFRSRRSSTGSSAFTSSPQIRHHPNVGATVVRNAGLVNNVQSSTALQKAIQAFSNEFRLSGQPFTVQTVLSPLIYRSILLKHSIFANCFLNAEQANQSLSSIASRASSQNLGERHLQHYNSAIHHLQTTINNPVHTDVNIGANLFLAFYSIRKGDLENWAFHIRSAAEQIRARGKILETHPLSLHTKFVFCLCVRTDTVGSNATGKPAATDSELVRIVYSGIPITNRSILPCRIDLELLLAEISVFQFQCANLLPINRAWRSPHEDRLQQDYEMLLARLNNWQGLNPGLVAVEEAQTGEHMNGSTLPVEMGLPLLCVATLSISQLLIGVRLIKNSPNCGSSTVLQLFISTVLLRGITSRTCPMTFEIPRFYVVE